jgi:hypothetical protein
MKFVSEEGQEATKVLPWIPATKTAGLMTSGLTTQKGWTKLDQMTSLRISLDLRKLSYDQLRSPMSLM